MKVKNTLNGLKLLFSYREINAYKEVIEARENAIVSDTLNYMYSIIGKNRVMLVDFILAAYGDVWMNFNVTELMFVNANLVAKIDGEYKVRDTLLHCGSKTVSKEAEEIKYNIPELFI